MNSKTLAAIAVIAVVIIVAVCALIVMNGSDDKEDDTASHDPIPMLRTDVKVGDYIEVRYKYVGEDAYTERHEITAIDGTSCTVRVTDDEGTHTETMTASEFVADLYEEDIDQLTKSGSEVVDTPWGNILLDKYTGSTLGMSVTEYVDSNGVSYKMSVTGLVSASLTACSLLS